MVNHIYTPDDRRLPSQLRTLQRSIADASRPTGTEKNQTVAQMRALLADLEAEVEFLSGQMVFASGPTDDREIAVEPAQNTGGVVYLPFNASNDASLSFEAPESGSVLVEVSGYCLARAGAGISSTESIAFSAQAILAWDLLDSNGAEVLPPAARRSVASYFQGATWINTPNAGGNGLTGANMAPVTGLTPGAVYRVRTRMGYSFTIGAATYNFSWQRSLTNSPRLVVTKLR